MMDLKQRMKLYEASHQKEKLTLNESLFEDTYSEKELRDLAYEAVKWWYNQPDVDSISWSDLMKKVHNIDMDSLSNEEVSKFNRYLDSFSDQMDGVENDTEVSVKDEAGNEIKSAKDAGRWLERKISEYGNTYFFPSDIRRVLNNLINEFGSTYFWHRVSESLAEGNKLTEEAEDISELVRADTAAYKEMKKYRKNSRAYKDAFEKWLQLHSQLTKKMYGGNVSFKVNESMGEADIPEEDPIITEPVSDDHATPEVTATPEQAGIQSMLQDLIKDEWDAIDGYSGTIQTLKAMGGYDDLCGVLQEISNEELIHVGQLQKALEFVNPVVEDKIVAGEEEATEQMVQASTLPKEG